MERTIFAFALMALLIAGGIGMGLYLRSTSRARSRRQRLDREKFKRQVSAVTANRGRLSLRP